MKGILKNAWSSLLAALAGMGAFSTLLPNLFEGLNPYFVDNKYILFIVFLVSYFVIPLLPLFVLYDRWLLKKEFGLGKRPGAVLLITWTLIVMIQVLFCVAPHVLTLSTAIVFLGGLASVVGIVFFFFQKDLRYPREKVLGSRIGLGTSLFLLVLVGSSFLYISARKAQESSIFAQNSYDPYAAYHAESTGLKKVKHFSSYLDSLDRQCLFFHAEHFTLSYFQQESLNSFGEYQKIAASQIDLLEKVEARLSVGAGLMDKEISDLIEDAMLTSRGGDSIFLKNRTPQSYKASASYLRLAKAIASEIEQEISGKWFKEKVDMVFSIQTRFGLTFFFAMFVLLLLYIRVDSKIVSTSKSSDAEPDTPYLVALAKARSELQGYLFLLLLLTFPLLKPAKPEQLKGSTIFKQNAWFFPAYVVDIGSSRSEHSQIEQEEKKGSGYRRNWEDSFGRNEGLGTDIADRQSLSEEIIALHFLGNFQNKGAPESTKILFERHKSYLSELGTTFKDDAIKKGILKLEK